MRQGRVSEGKGGPFAVASYRKGEERRKGKKGAYIPTPLCFCAIQKTILRLGGGNGKRFHSKLPKRKGRRSSPAKKESAVSIIFMKEARRRSEKECGFGPPSRRMDRPL